jgi:hypothetical protein
MPCTSAMWNGATRTAALGACLGMLSVSLACAGGPPFVVASDFTIGGTGHDRVTDLVVDAGGNAYVSGVVGSYNFPGVSSAAVTNAGVDLRFVAKVAPLGRTASFVAVVGSPTSSMGGAGLGAFGTDEAAGLAIDAGGNAFVVAYDGSRDYPVSGGAYQGSTGKKYVFKVSATGQVARLSAALDPAINRVGAIAVDGAGAIYLTGSARDGLPTSAGAPYPTSSVAAGCIAPYVMKLDASGQAVLYATYLGNSGTQGSICGGQISQARILSTNIHPTGHAIAIDGAGNAYVTGQAEPGLPATPGSPDFGTKTVGPTGYNNLITDPASHAFVSKINAAGTAIVYTARLGGSLRDRGTSIVVDPTGAAIVAGKTSSPDFPIVASAVGGRAGVTMECLLWTPEFGFLAKLSPDGRQVAFSGYLPLDGSQLDDCQGYGPFAPAKVAIDSGGNIYVAGGTTATNRGFYATADAIIPDAIGSQAIVGGQVFQVFSADGQRKLYSTALARNGVQGIAVDPWQNVIIADNFGGLQRLSPGRMPVDIGAGPGLTCAGQATSLVSNVAGSNDVGSVDFQVDGASVGTASIVNGSATATATLASGVRRVRATYHGVGPFDGYSSPDLYLAVNQAGACQ